ncbi:MAG: helix-turn-helix domain-containing protein [Magnetococcales bacterium]|nr:helix-turn-helix domain-containing protein [Magnetococcales bacterium]
MNGMDESTRRRRGGRQSCEDQGEVACIDCNLFGFLQLFASLEPEMLRHFLTTHVPLGKGEVLYRAGQPFEGVYAVKSGGFKSIVMQEPYGEQVASFHLPGEMMGVEDLQSETCSFTVLALEESKVCFMPVKPDRNLNEHFPTSREQMVKILLEHLRQCQRQGLILGMRTAEERLGAFFLNLAERYARHGFPLHEFRVPMMQNDIANHLGLAMETVSRTLKHFRELEMLTIRGKRGRILNPGCLQSITQYCFRKKETDATE